MRTCGNHSGRDPTVISQIDLPSASNEARCVEHRNCAPRPVYHIFHRITAAPQETKQNKSNRQHCGALWVGQREMPPRRFSHSSESTSSAYLPTTIPRLKTFRQQGCLQEQSHMHDRGSIAGCICFAFVWVAERFST